MKTAIIKLALLFTAITAFFSLSTIALLFSSCQNSKEENKSNWVCTCKYRKKTKDTTVKYMYPNQTKEAASKACDKQEAYLQSVHGPTGTSCSNGF